MMPRDLIQASGVAGERTPPLGVVEVSASEAKRVAVWWLGVHGGAGESTLEALFAGSRATEHHWPVSPGTRVPVVLVARTDARGLRAAQRAMRGCVERALPVLVLGLVLMADVPGALPRVLRDLKRVVSGGVPRVWSLPFVTAWRLGEEPRRGNAPKEAGRLREDLRAALAQT